MSQRYPIQPDGVLGVATDVVWETGAGAPTTRLLDAVGQWALTATFDPPLNDVTRNKQLQVRDVITGDVRSQIDVPGWCSGPDGADYPCVLLDKDRLARTTPLDGIRAGSVTISSTETAAKLAKFGPFPALAAVRATSSPDALVLITYEGSDQRYTAHTLDLRTGETATIGSLPISQPFLCVLGTDSILTVEESKLVSLGPAPVAPIAVPELDETGPEALGCTPDGEYLLVRGSSESESDTELIINAVLLLDGTRSRTVLETAPSETALRLTR